MSSHPVSPQNVLARHGGQIQQVLAKLKVDNAREVDWSYEMAQRIDGQHRVRRDKGVNILLRNPSAYYIGLRGKAGRKSHTAELDIAALVAGDRSCLPVEVFTQPRPDGPSLYLWEPLREASPGWNEAVVVKAQVHTSSGAMALEAITDDGSRHFLERDTLGRWSQRAEGRAGKAWSLASSAELAEALEGLEEGCVPAGGVPVADLLQALGMGQHEAQEVGQDLVDTHVPASGGRKWAWGQQVPDEDAALHEALVSSKSGASSGSFLDVIGALADPTNHIKDAIAREVLVGYAQGKTPLEAARQAIAARDDLPDMPEGEQDVVAFIQAHGKAGGGPVGIRPVMLGGRRR